MRYFLPAVLTIFLLYCSGVAIAQPEPGPDDETMGARAAVATETPAPPDPQPNGAVSPEGQPAAVPETHTSGQNGDALTLKTGKVLQNVQVLKSTPEYYEVEIREGIEPLRIPRKQVTSVSLDNVDPLKLRRQQALLAKERESNLIAGQKTSPDLDAKLNADISEPPLSYADDFVTVLQDLGQKFSVTIEIAPPVLDIAPQDRQWQYDSRPGLTLHALLREDLLKSFPQLDVVYQFDKILITTKAAAQPPSPEPPAAPAALPEAASPEEE